MVANYHTHTPRCNHAVGTEYAYAEEASRAGVKILGFSDHSPYLFADGYVSGVRMKPEMLPDYVESVLAVRKAFAGVMDVRLGVEMEYYPGPFSDTVAMLRDNGVEYLLLGQHFLGNEAGELYNAVLTRDDRALVRYCDQTIEGMQTGLFTYLAHPDVIHYAGDETLYRHHMRRICREAKSCGMPLEWNLLGMVRGKNYPDLRFWELAAEEGCSCILGVDAHDPLAFREQETEAKAREIIRSLGMELLDMVELRLL